MLKIQRSRIRFSSKRQWEYQNKNGITVSCYGIPKEFQDAFLKILTESKSLYNKLFGKHAVGNVEFNVRKSAGLQHRLWTNGADRIFLTLSKKRQLEPAKVSGVRNLHGLPHELAHIVLYRSLINLSCLAPGWGEGWAVYMASFIAIPHLYRKFGPGLWPYPHNFERSDGPAIYLKRFGVNNKSVWHPIDQVVWQLHRLEHTLGRREFVNLVRKKLSTPIRADLFAKQMEDLLKSAGVPQLTVSKGR